MSAHIDGCGICEVLPTIDSALVLSEDEYWTANLRGNDQTLLGTSFITLRRHAYELDQLTPAEDASFIVIRNRIINAIRQSFLPITFNVSCLKNDAFGADPDATPAENAHVHYHVKPRYTSQPMEYFGETFTDPLPGKYLSTFERKTVLPEIAMAIAAIIRQHL